MRFLLLLSVLLLSCVGNPVSYTNNVWTDSRGNPTRWEPSKFPLEIVVDRSLRLNRFLALREAVEEWNAEIGREVFVISNSTYDPFGLPWTPRSGKIYVADVMLPQDTHGITHAEWKNNVFMDYAYVYISTSVTDDLAQPVFLHELGHVLGLGHDSDQRSIMYRSALGSGRQIMSDDIAYIRWETEHGG